MVRPDGSPGVYGVVHFASLAVGIVALDADDRVVLVGQHRYPLDIYSWEIPEGGVPAGEDPLDGARRELREETGRRGGRAGARSGASTCRTRSPTKRASSTWRAGLSQEAAAPEATEELAVRWVPFEEALAMTLDGRITDAMAIMGIQRLAIERAGRLRHLTGGRAPGQAGGARSTRPPAAHGAPDGTPASSTITLSPSRRAAIRDSSW